MKIPQHEVLNNKEEENLNKTQWIRVKLLTGHILPKKLFDSHLIYENTTS